MTIKFIAIASDHAGFQLKQYLMEDFDVPGWKLTDFGSNGEESVDYPDYAKLVVNKITSKQAELGVLICATGIGMSITANRNSCIRAALCFNQEMAILAREHNDANVIVFPGNFMERNQALGCLYKFIHSKFTAGRHTRRIDKINLLKD